MANFLYFLFWGCL